MEKPTEAEARRDQAVATAMSLDVANCMRYCPDCNRAVVVFRDPASRDTVCTRCTRLLNHRYVDRSTDWCTFLLDDHDVGAVGAAATTAVQPAGGSAQSSSEASDNDTHGGAEGACSAPAVPRMPKVRAAAVHDKSLADAFHSMDGMAERLGLAEAVRDRARDVFRKLEDVRAFPKGGKCRNRRALHAACLHVACRAVGTPRTFKELASVTGDSATAGIKDIGRLVKHLKLHLHLGEEDGGVGGQAAAGEMMMMMGAVVRAGDYLRRFGSLLGMGDQEVDPALEAARRLEKNLDVRRNPDSIAAAVIYMALQRAGAGKSIRDVSAATGVSEVTIREVYYKDLTPHADLLFG